jgi:hypothetical protein
MDSILEKSFDRQRALLFGLLVNCIFSEGPKESCPLSELRSNLSIEEKHKYVMGLSDEEVKSILVQHEECYEKRLLEIKQG